MLAIGLNLSSYKISIVELLKFRNNLTVRKMVKVELPPKCVVKGEVQDNMALTDSLRDIWKKHKISDKKVFIGIANQKIIAKEIKIPVINDEEISNSIQYQINDFIPIPKNNVIYDYYIVEKGEDHSRVMLVGAMKSMINDVVLGFKKAGLLAQAIDLNCFALYRTIDYIYKIEEGIKNNKGKEPESICVVNLGLEISIIEMIHSYNLKYPRFTSTSLKNFIDEIYKETKKDNKYCEDLLRKFDFMSLMGKKSEDLVKGEKEKEKDVKAKSDKSQTDKKENKKTDEKKEKSESKPDIDPARINEAIKSVADRFISEIKLSIEHFLQENPKAKLKKIVLTGDYIKNIDKYMEKEIE
ncbi:MAG: pilus assembly protein PilM, partial [Actinomycetota bacterium]|nr:pilus assembly protein PilM [Actinomycetota bacterium]